MAPGKKRLRPVDESRQLLTSDEVAERLNVSRYTVLKLSKAGTFAPPIMIRNSLRWKQSDIDEFIEKNREAR